MMEVMRTTMVDEEGGGEFGVRMRGGVSMRIFVDGNCFSSDAKR